MVRPFVFAEIQRLAHPVNFREEIALELDGFSEYAAEVTVEQQKAIDDLAVRIIKSNQTRDPIFEFRVEGHADIARRLPAGAERTWMEDNVSRERASTGFDLLVDALKRKGGDDIAKRVAKGSRSFGLGTRQLKVPNASTEAQFKKNRRVVFVIRLVTFLPPPPQPQPNPSSVVEERFSAQLIKAAVVSVGITEGVESYTVTATVQVTDKIQKKFANFHVIATGGGIGGGPTPLGGSISDDPGPVVNFKIFRLTAAASGNISLQSFVGGVTVFIDIGGGAGSGSTSKGGTLSFSFDALESAGCNTQPNVIRLPGGKQSLSAPGISAGGVAPLGRMTMIGQPQSL